MVLSHELPETIELSEMLTGVPDETLAKMYSVPEAVFAAIPKETIVIGGGPAPTPLRDAAE